MEKYIEIERSILKRFRKEIWRKFITAVNDYQLIKEGDKIAVCISGGKDSMLLAKCMQELKKHGKVHFDLVFMVMDPGYNPYNKQIILDNAEYLNIPIEVFNSNIFEVVASVPDSPCYLCAKMRRGYLYKHAQELGCNKIALGHHFDDVIETVLMSMLYSGQMKGMMPKLHSTNYEGMELIRPLYMVKEADILAWKKYNNLTFIQCACRLTENCMLGDNGMGSKRQEMKELVKKFRQTSSVIDMNIFRSIHNVNLDTMIGYQKHQVSHSFLDDYDSELPVEVMAEEE
ncbi:tRNA(Ile)-lysidine synthase TilS/MesJ [Anaerocolumna jejuensis DSM 15929]|uniref:tRNA(Ile)-lysidine synthase TilS/MesJ n=1 Tax=Anaerocolumna jejuensis DSM 15929 TaxID=1121322 RepID=A0A1M6WL57_9FIRM|nr:ATP-binding protein [Anaerocolumna jejuensis]SHK94431.1 tRNA(Ile)-lysidine synthase TilS/MesJ [Anaerocolumna jejuensis DSM 15929]